MTKKPTSAEIEIDGFELTPTSYQVYGTPFSIEQRHGFDGEKWCVKYGNQCLSRNGIFSYEPIPSSRTEEFLENHRFDTIECAVSALRLLYNKDSSDEK